jgi:hypothetical protein
MSAGEVDILVPFYGDPGSPSFADGAPLRAGLAD